jgi:hypothetical protein
MKYFSFIFVLFFTASFAGIFFPAQFAYAQKATGPTSSNAPNSQDAQLAKQACKAKLPDPGATGATCSVTNNDKSITTCGGPNQQGASIDYCTIKYPDGTYTTLDENGSDGSWISYAANGTKIGSHDAGFANIAGIQDTGTAQGAKANPTAPPPPDSGICNLLKPGSWPDCLSFAGSWLALALLSFAGVILGLSGTLFNWIVVITVFQFGSYFGNSVGLLTAWGILRDIGNILLLFGFIFMGIIMILDLHTIDTRKAIPTLIIMAVLINFSLFAAEAVIDVANVLSASMYNQAGSNDQCTTAVSSGSTDACVNQGIAAKVIDAAGLSGAFTSKDGAAAQLTKLGTDNTHKLIVYLALTVFVAVTAVVLLAASVMLIIRAVVLTFVMVLAPLGFAAMAIPPLAGLGKQWRDMLISQAFFAPVYLLLLLVSLKIMETVKQTMTGGNNPATIFDALNNANTTYGTIFIVFALVIGFMIAALMSAKKLGAIGADFATSFATKTVRGTMTAPVRTIGAPIYRNTVGWSANKLANLETKPGFAGGVARKLNSITAGGYQSSLKKVKESKFLGDHSYQERKDFNKHESHTADIAKNKGIVLNGLKAAPGSAERAAMESAFQKLPEADALALVNGLGAKDAKAAGAFLSTGKFKKLVENKDLDHHAKDHLVEGRYQDARAKIAAIETARNTGNAAQITAAIDGAKEAVKEYSAKEFEIMATNDTKLFAETFKAEAADGGSLIKEGIIDDLIKNEMLNSVQQGEARAARKTEKIKALLASKTPAAPLTPAQLSRIKTLVQKSEAKRLAELSNDNLLQPEIASGMDREKMAAIMAKTGTFDVAQRETFLQNLEAKFPRGTAEHGDINAYLGSPAVARYWRRLLR